MFYNKLHNKYLRYICYLYLRYLRNNLFHNHKSNFVGFLLSLPSLVIIGTVLFFYFPFFFIIFFSTYFTINFYHNLFLSSLISILFLVFSSSSSKSKSCFFMNLVFLLSIFPFPFFTQYDLDHFVFTYYNGFTPLFTKFVLYKNCFICFKLLFFTCFVLSLIFRFLHSILQPLVLILFYLGY